jgi:hypothetical protein
LAKLEIKFQGTQTYQSEIRVTTLIGSFLQKLKSSLLLVVLVATA